MNDKLRIARLKIALQRAFLGRAILIFTGFSHAPCSNYRSIFSSGSYYLEDFDYRSILVDSGIIVHCSKRLKHKGTMFINALELVCATFLHTLLI